MRINRIGRLRNCRVFRDFTWPADLHDFARFNLIYGWNGSGKTTVSRIFRDLELRRPPTIGDVHLSIGNQDIPGSDFPSASTPVRVFNRDFVNENVFPTGGGQVPPILILGKENIEKQKQLEDLKAKLTDVDVLLQTEQNERKSAAFSLDQYCITRGGAIKELLRSSGNNPFNNYDKSKYSSRAQQMLSDGDVGNHRLEDSKREGLSTQHRASPKPKIEELTYREPNFDSLRSKTADVLSETVVSEIIQSLRDDAETSRWVRQGLDLHKKQGSTECLFCDQALPGQRLSALERHFSTAYESLMNSLDELSAGINHVLASVSKLDAPQGVQFYEHLVTEYEAISIDIELYRTKADTYLNSLANAVSNKKELPFESMPMDTVMKEAPDSTVLGRLNGIIQKHNKVCENHTASATDARKQLECGAIAEGLDEFRWMSASVEVHDASIASIKSQARDLRAEISGLEVDITEYWGPAEELNDDLHKYVGHKELQLEVRDNGYTLTRNGVPASQLSEGEITAIALLYFLKSLTDHRFDFPNGAVVLDDPISSLDANSLFLAYGFTQERTKDAGQLFILTHNFTFFRQVRNWFHHIKGQLGKDVSRRPARFYMLNCLSDDKGRYSNIQHLDPLLEQYESDYHYLFACVQRSASSSISALETNYMLPNMARRLLEAFLAFRQPDVSGELRQKMLNVDFDEAKKSQILRFVHTYSHNDAIVEPDHDPSLLGEAPAVLSGLLELINKEDPRHFERMMKLVTKGNDDEDEL